MAQPIITCVTENYVNFLRVPGVSFDESISDETCASSGRQSRIDVVPDEILENLSDDEDVSLQLPMKDVSSLDSYSHSPEVKLDTIDPSIGDTSRGTTSCSIVTMVTDRGANESVQNSFSFDSPRYLHDEVEPEQQVKDKSGITTYTATENDSKNTNRKLDNGSIVNEHLDHSDTKREHSESDSLSSHGSEDEYSSNYEDLDDSEDDDPNVARETTTIMTKLALKPENVNTKFSTAIGDPKLKHTLGEIEDEYANETFDNFEDEDHNILESDKSNNDVDAGSDSECSNTDNKHTVKSSTNGNLVHTEGERDSNSTLSSDILKVKSQTQNLISSPHDLISKNNIMISNRYRSPTDFDQAEIESKGIEKGLLINLYMKRNDDNHQHHTDRLEESKDKGSDIRVESVSSVLNSSNSIQSSEDSSDNSSTDYDDDFDESDDEDNNQEENCNSRRASEKQSSESAESDTNCSKSSSSTGSENIYKCDTTYNKPEPGSNEKEVTIKGFENQQLQAHRNNTHNTSNSKKILNMNNGIAQSTIRDNISLDKQAKIAPETKTVVHNQAKGTILNELSVENSMTRPVSSYPERCTQTSKLTSSAQNNKILHKRKPSLPNRLSEENNNNTISTSTHAESKNKQIESSQITRKHIGEGEDLLKSPQQLPLLCDTNIDIKSTESSTTFTNNGSLNKAGQNCIKENIICNTKPSDSKHNEKVQDGIVEPSKQKAIKHVETDRNKLDANSLGTSAAIKLQPLGNQTFANKGLPSSNIKLKTRNPLSERIAPSHQKSCKGKAKINKGLSKHESVYSTERSNSTQLNKQENYIKLHQKSNSASKDRNVKKGSDTGHLNKKQVDKLETYNETDSKPVHAGQQRHTCAPKKPECSPKKIKANQYSIPPTTAVLISEGNCSSKTVMDKTNGEYLITENKLISQFVPRQEKQIESNYSTINSNTAGMQDVEPEYYSSIEEETESSMDCETDSKLSKQKGLKKRLSQKYLYRSHSRPKPMNDIKTENRSLKYGLDRPSSPFIFNNSKLYVRQSSVRSISALHNEDNLARDAYDKFSTRTGFADLARLKDIRRQLHLADEEFLEDSEGGNIKKCQHGLTSGKLTDLLTTVPQETQTIVATILNDVMAAVCSSAGQPKNVLKRKYTTRNADGEEVFFCMVQAPYFTFNLSVVNCQVINILDVRPVTKTRHETLISHVVQIDPQNPGDICSENGVVVFLPIKDTCMQSWQEPIVRELDDNGEWVDVLGRCCITQLKGGEKAVSGVEVKIKEGKTLVVVARPKVDVFYTNSSDVSLTSSVDNKIKVGVGLKHIEQKRRLTLQVVPIDVHMLTWFSRLHCDDEDYQILSSSPLVNVEASGQHAESLMFNIPYSSIYSRSRKHSVFSFPTSCVHSPMLRIPSPYFNKKAKPNPTQASSDVASNPSVGTKVASRNPRRISQTQHLKGKTKVHIPAGEKHLVQIQEDHDNHMRLVSLTKIEGHTGDIHTFNIFESSASVMVIETRTGLQYTSIGEVIKAFIEFISLRKVTVKVYQTLADPQRLYVIMVDSRSKPVKCTDEALCYTHTETELLLNEGDIIAYSFKGNIQCKKAMQRQFRYHTFSGLRTSCLLDVQNPYGQRSLPTFHGMVQIFSKSDFQTGLIDTNDEPDFSVGWDCLAEIPVSLPKSIAKLDATVFRAPLALRLEEPLTPDFVRLLCRELRNDWERFAKELRISQARIQSIKQQNKNTIPERILMDILASWLKRQPKADDKSLPLVGALRRCNKLQLAAELKERQKTMSIVRSETAEDLKLKKAINLVCKSATVSKRWRQLFVRLCVDSKIETSDEVEDIETSNLDDNTCCHKALTRWKDMSSKPTVWNLVDALRSTKCTVVADAVFTQFVKGI